MILEVWGDVYHLCPGGPFFPNFSFPSTSLSFPLTDYWVAYRTLKIRLFPAFKGTFQLNTIPSHVT